MTNPETEILSGTDLAYAIGRQWRPPTNGTDPGGRRNARYMYWKRCEDQNCVQHTAINGVNPEAGWVILGPDRVSDMDAYTRFIDIKHCTPLPEFGTMLVEGSGSSLPENRFRQILENPRGIYAFPVSQIVAYGWDMIPEVRMARPDLPMIERISCTYGCPPNRKFVTQEDYATHITARHSEATAANALGEAIKGSVSTTTDPGAIAAAVVAAMQTYLPVIMAQVNPTSVVNAVEDEIDVAPRRR